ncbi:signal recognition particle 9 kDa protein-like [Oscarella lobularis]|uniref:signal recognition particle 9 kDa protein-like n=1 Tax=Oscarella lobularis TaxID=121494 RepID=UPI0033143791
MTCVSLQHSMPFVSSWDEFARTAEQLYLANPYKTRFVVKYRHCDAKMILKITDDVACIKYATDQAQDVKRLEKLNNTLLRLMVSKAADAK